MFGQLLGLSMPVLAEHALHMVVGVNDTYLANHLGAESTDAAAAVGTVTYFLWFLGLMTSALGVGSTALIARAIGARHRRLANAVCGQSITAAIVLGLGLAATFYVAAGPIAQAMRLHGAAQDMAERYLQLLAVSLPFTTVMFVAGPCLRGAGDTISPALAMIAVDVINIVSTFALCRGWWGLPAMGFDGIAAGTVIAYVAGGMILFAVLVRGRGGIKLHLHRMRPKWHTLRRVLRIGLPSGAESFIAWGANLAVVVVINALDPTNAMAAAHINAIRIESASFMAGFAVATAVATLVGQNLGAKDPARAARAAWLGYALGGGIMTACGLFFILFGHYPAGWISDNPEVAAMTTTCLFITGFIQPGFAASAVFGGALRGAGDTVAVMVLNLLSVVGVRFTGVLVVGLWLRQGLAAVWIVLAGELFLRGTLVFLRFVQGRWKRIEV